jgi:hypothetical protein
MFETFRRWVESKGTEWMCEACGKPYDLYIESPFAFGADGQIRVIHIFAPPKPRRWNHEGRLIEYHPFLVIGETLTERPQRTAWLPYWHTDEHNGGRRPKYGQWAPHMDLDIFSNLVDQARVEGLLPWPPT